MALGPTMTKTFDVRLSCRCGKVQGSIRGITPTNCNHAVCLCDDCQLYAAFLATPGITDANGGTEITQVAHNQISISTGREYVACVRLYSKGMHRWYAHCCNTPLVNTMGPKSLFGGVVHACVQESIDGGSLVQALGPIRERVQGKFGKGELPAGTSRTISFRMLVHILRRFAVWAIARTYKPSTFFSDGSPFVAPQVLNERERAQLRSHV
jgi:hypothetical protein